TFPRVLARYVRERGVLDWPEAAHRMTGLPAAAFGVPDRGVVRPGAVADLVAFDPLAVADRATYADPLRPPVGIGWVMQAGRLAALDGTWTGRRAGIRLSPD
uniref:amidohydrolase family protein n=1 Tax=Nocardioides sp. R-C-SC26 TaxID=2870414 RepID=UPI001E4DFADC